MANHDTVFLDWVSSEEKREHIGSLKKRGGAVIFASGRGRIADKYTTKDALAIRREKGSGPKVEIGDTKKE